MQTTFHSLKQALKLLRIFSFIFFVPIFLLSFILLMLLPFSFAQEFSFLSVTPTLLFSGEKATLAFHGEKNAHFTYWVEDEQGTVVQEKKKATAQQKKLVLLQSDADLSYFTVHALSNLENDSLCMQYVIVQNENVSSDAYASSLSSSSSSRFFSSSTSSSSDVLYQTSLSQAISLLPWIFLGLAIVLSIAWALWQEEL